MLFGASTSGPAVTIQRFTPQEFVAACSGYDVTIRCEGTGVEFYPDGSISSTGGEFYIESHDSHEIVVSGYSEDVLYLSLGLLTQNGGEVYSKVNYPDMCYAFTGSNKQSFGSDDYVWEDTSGNYHLLLASNTRVTSTLNHS